MKRLYFFSALLFLLFCSSASAQFLVEAFRNVDCLNCKTPDAQYEAYLATKPDYKVQIVYIHNNFPAASDPFYLVSNHDVDYRSGTFYKVIADPDVFVSGISAGSTFSNWKSLTDETAVTGSSYPSNLIIGAYLDPTGMIHVDLQVTPNNASNQSVRPYVMLVESGIQYNNTLSYGNPTSGTWDNIFRAMIPASQGGDIFSLTTANSLHYTYDPTGKPWVLANCKIIAFLQEVTAQSDGISRKIDGFSSVSINLDGVSASRNKLSPSIGAPIPNPSVSSAQIPFHLAAPANVKIVVCDELGREVRTIYNGFAESSSFATFMPDNLSKGIYYARMYAGGEYVGMQKIVFAP